MPNIEKVKVPSAITRRTKLDLSHDHITTLQFGVPQIVSYRHMLKDEKLDMRCVATVRPFPLAVPTFGRMRLNLRSFFVPYSLVFPLFNEFYVDTLGSDSSQSSLVSSPPLVTTRVLQGLFLNRSSASAYPFQLCEIVPNETPQPAFDFSVGGGNYFKFTPLGRIFIKTLHSLGYRFVWDNKDSANYNALGLLAYIRVFYDWYRNQNYLNSAESLAVKQIFEYRDPTSPFVFRDSSLFESLLFTLHCCYDNDAYFNASWDNPSGPVLSQTSMFSFDDITAPVSNQVVNVHTMANGTPVMSQTSDNVQSVGTQYIHDTLKMLSDYQKRHQLSSALPVSRWLAQWGSDVPSLSNKRSIYVGAKSVDINVGDIMSTASTEGAELGDYAGRSFGQGDGTWSFSSKEFGVFIVIASVLPTGSLYQGCDRNNMSLDKFDFFQPEADGLSVQAIAKREVLTPMTSEIGNPAELDKVFGFTGRYGHYKRPLSFVTGDFELPAANIGGSSWHLNRMLEYPMQVSFDYANLGHSESFTMMEDRDLYNRIFNHSERHADYFFGDFHFDVAVFAPCRPLFDTYQFEDVGKSVTLDNGAFVN